MSKYQFKMTDLLQFQFKLLFCFEKKKKYLMLKKNRNEHCVNLRQKYRLEKTKTNWRNCNKEF